MMNRKLPLLILLFGFALVLLAMPTLADAHPTKASTKAKPDPNKSLEDQLLDDLEADLLDDESFDGELLDEEKPAATRKEPADAADLESKLLGEIEEGLDEEDVSNDDEEDPITKIGRKMRDVEQRLAESRVNDETKQIQLKIVKELADLLDELKKQMKKKSSPKPGGKKPKTAQRKPVNQPKRGAGKPSGTESKQPARDSQEGVRDAKEIAVDMREMDDLMKELSKMMLPDKAREQMRQGAVEKFLPQYEPLIERYLRRLAEEEDGSR